MYVHISENDKGTFVCMPLFSIPICLFDPICVCICMPIYVTISLYAHVRVRIEVYLHATYVGAYVCACWHVGLIVDSHK